MGRLVFYIFFRLLRKMSFERDVMKYLRNLATKFHYLSNKIDQIEKNQEELRTLIVKFGQATGIAFNQTKEVVNKLAEVTEETRMDLSEYGGLIQNDSFFRGC